MHRSGTTLLGKILSTYRELHIIHEPLNREYGLYGVDHIYPCDLDQWQCNYYTALLERLSTGRADCIRYCTSDSRMKSLARFATGGRTGIDIAKFNLRKLSIPNLRPVYKDPFEVLLSDILIKNGHKVIALIRHPAAIWLSVKRMDWRFNFNNFAYPEVFKDLEISVPTEPLDSLSEIERFAWLWMAIYSYLNRLTDNNSFLLIRHEELCTNPYDVLERIEIFLSLKAHQKSRQFIDLNMFSKVVTPNSKRLHLFERNSRSLAFSWVENIGNDENVLKGICGNLVEQHYGDWKPI